MIMGDKCTRRCPFCDVGHGRPDPLDTKEPGNLARTIAALKLNYVVITSVDRDDLRDDTSKEIENFLNSFGLIKTIQVKHSFGNYYEDIYKRV
jgi:lipoate synthase